jgi:hypothetical protein
MQLDTNQYGIVKMFNKNTKTNRDEIRLHKLISLKGPINRQGNDVNLGYNETIHCDSEKSASELLRRICNFLNE